MLQNYRFSGTFKTVTLTNNTIQLYIHTYTILYIIYNNINNYTILQTTIHNNTKQ